MLKLDSDTLARSAVVFTALGDSTRLALVVELSDGRAQSISKLTRGTGLTRQGVTKHLFALEAAGVVVKERAGRETLFSLRPQPLEETAEVLAKISRQWDDAIHRLKTFLQAK